LLTVPLAGYILLRSYWPEAGEILAMILKSAQIILTLKYRSEKKIKWKLFSGLPVRLKTAAVLQQKAFCHIPME